MLAERDGFGNVSLLGIGLEFCIDRLNEPARHVRCSAGFVGVVAGSSC